MSDKKRILIVDDDPDIVELYSNALATKNYVIETAADGEEALMKVIENKPDLVLLDIMLPNMHGIEVLQKIREDQKIKTVKVIILSALSDSQTLMQAKKLGIEDFLIKAQYSLPEVISRVEQAL